MKNIEVGQVWVLASSIQAVVERVFTEHWQPDCRVRLLHSSGLLSVMRSQLRFLVREADGGPPWIKSPGYCPAFDDTLDYDLWMGDGEVLNADTAADDYSWDAGNSDDIRIDFYRVRPKGWKDAPGAPVNDEHLRALGIHPATTRPVDVHEAPEVNDKNEVVALRLPGDVLDGLLRKNPHYFRSVGHLTVIDVYRVLELFEVTDPCIQHAVKKLLVAGGRGHKDIGTDINDAIVSLERWQEMRREDGHAS